MYKTMPMPFVIWMTYIQTFLLFPGVNIEKITYNGICNHYL